MSSTPPEREPIAIIGSACRFAGGATSPSKLWDLLNNPRDVRSDIPKSRFNADAFYHPNPAYHGHSNIRQSYLIEDDVTTFDTEFFGIKPIEAKAIDPQQRVLMEVVYEGLESAGLTIDSLRGSDTAVYVGVMCSDYEANIMRDLSSAPTYTATGIGRSILSNRISYFFDWHGPSITLDTACSSSLVAVHLAVQSLRSGESRVALACGSNLLLGPENYIMESKLKMLSPDGQSKMWDSAANGYARGDGVAAITLKTMSAAIADGDHIECIIRETGTNQDGATTGITMPGAASQQSLIRSTYQKAGLDVFKDRPQFFEAHGTGTPAGDPIEAEAISKAFFGSNFGVKIPGDPLYVGSIKTVLGHTEGTAGVAALMKASLGLQHSCIPPNMLLNSMSETVKPFAKNLSILKEPLPWPQPQAGQPKRASVNSFGFGGANAHAILEAYEPAQKSAGQFAGTTLFSPFVFSALTRHSLQANLSAYADFIGANPLLSLRDFAYTLQQRRSALPYRISIAADSADALESKIREELAGTPLENLGARVSASALGRKPKILGVFTGQGSQYTRMGAELIEKSATARSIIAGLQAHLDELPLELRPDWSLEKEICAAAADSQVTKGKFSSLSTAVQVMLVDLLKLAGIEFNTIVGHSSGEMAAAYAAGYLSARDVICVAYFRGFFVDKMASPNGGGIPGAMIAAGMSYEDALDLCSDRILKGRVCVAAVNSSSSVTISGDEDAIDEVKIILDDENRFNRKLRVDKAYHSNHLYHCAGPYVEAMRSVGCKAVEPPEGAPLWISSVYSKPMSLDMAISDEYWAENMVKPVLFHQGMKLALESGEYDLALEVGPHPALKGPATQTIQEVLGKAVPYQGVIHRGTDAVVSTASCLGFLWSHLGGHHIDLHAFETAMSDDKSTPRLLKGLPSYQWNHETSYWHESRAAKKIRNQTQPFNELLGSMLPDSSAHRLSWSQLLRVNELEWLSGHQVQSQTVFPAAGYVCTALEGGRVLAGERQVQLFELNDFVIHQALTFSADAGVEVLINLSDIRHLGSDRIQAKFTYSAGLGSEDMTLVAEAELRIVLDDASETTLPCRAATPPHMISVDPERLYTFLATLGYGFDGVFKSLTTLRRKLGLSRCSIKSTARNPFGPPLLVHPAEFDGAIQSLILAYSYPDDDQLLTMHLPTRIGKIRFNPTLCKDMTALSVDAKLGSSNSAAGSGFSGDVNLYTNTSPNAAIQLEHVSLKPLGATTASMDRKVFSKSHWIPSTLDGNLAASDTIVTEEHASILSALERISTYYLQHFDTIVPRDSPLRSDPQHMHYLRYARYITDLVARGQHKNAKEEWLQDSFEDMMAATARFAHLPDVRVMHLVGQEMPRVFNGETNMLQEMRNHNVLDDYYAGGFGFLQSGLWMSRTIAQLAERYPHMNILEIGAGTGGATKRILKHLDSSFLTYTFTDVSSGFFDSAASVFAAYKDRMIYKTLDCGYDPVTQGYTEESYDVVVASLVIHATPNLEVTMRNIRRLVKPGGFLVVAEGSNNVQPHGTGGFIFGPLPGWWLGAENGRPWSPFVSTAEWDRLLKGSGFAGIDSIAPKAFEDVIGMTCFAAQAVDDRISFLRDPLNPAVFNSSAAPPIESLVVVGGITDQTPTVIRGLKDALADYTLQLRHFETLHAVDYSTINETTTVVCLTELDKPIFEDVTPEDFSAFKAMFSTPMKLLWVTNGRLADNPFSNMTVGFGRTAVHETINLQFQNIDFADLKHLDAKSLVEMVLRFSASTNMTQAERKQVLWAIEPEIAVDAAGEQRVQRLRPIAARNDRYNSARRPITHEVDTSEVSAVLTQDDSKAWSLKEISKWSTRGHDDSQTKIVVSHAIASAIRTPTGHKFLVLGRQPETNARLLALVPSLVSVVHVPKQAALPCPVSDLSDADFLTALAARLLAMAVIDPLVEGETVVVHNASELLAASISEQAALKNITTCFVTDSTQPPLAVLDSCISLAPYMTQSEVADALPGNPACFVGLSNHAAANAEVEATILSVLPPHCRKETSSTLYSAVGVQDSSSTADFSAQWLRRACSFLTATPTMISAVLTDIDDLVQGATITDPAAVIDWTRSQTHSVHVNRLDSAAFFKQGKTYWMCGLSGALGVSLCDWMIERGARYLVLTSRNPNISPDWIAAHRAKGVYVTIVPCDVTDAVALRAAHQHIVSTQPPIIGVLNGAMVLRDVSIYNMSFDQMADVFRPKVYGSLNLDSIFHSTPLDFFILFSSINCVIGNLGQANYSAANTFMCSLAAQRRARGLAATALNVGAIIGAGYMERESSKALDLTVSKMALMHLSEQDYHQLFAEGIDAGQPDSGDDAELTTGLLDILADEGPNAPRWQHNPTFSHFLVHQVEKTRGESGDGAVMSVKDQLTACKDAKDVLVVVKRTFAAQLRHVLQMTSADDDLMASRSSDIGLDSLISVDIRTWILQNFEVSVPVLKIMGNDTMADIAELVVDQVPSTLLGGCDIPLAASEPAAKTAPTPAVPIASKSSESHSSSASTASDSNDESSIPTRAVSPSLETRATTPDSAASPERKIKRAGDVVDWDAEIVLPNAAPIAIATDLVPASTPRSVVLTGVSGLLGRQLLNQLLENDSVQQIFCIATRRLDERFASGELARDARIKYFAGDLEQPRLGLSLSDATNIFSHADVVIHNAADTSHLKFYPAIRAANTGSTRELISLCMARKVPIHYLSTVGVALFGNFTSFLPVSVAAHLPPADGSHGYVAAKWASERLLEGYSAQHGVKTWIHRPSTIIRSGKDATNAAAQIDWMNALMSYMTKTLAVPSFRNLRGSLDFVALDAAADSILGAVFAKKSSASGPLVAYVHQVGTLSPPLDRLRDFVQEKTGAAEVQVLPVAQWAEKAVSAGLHPGIAALIESMDDPGQPHYPKMLKAAQ